MERYARAATIVVTAALTLLSVACSSTPPGVNRALATVAPYPPPPKRAEIPPLAPSADSLWEGGHWNWNGSKYLWTPGSYLQRPTPTANRMPGYWEQDSSGGWIWTEGHWQS
jgi:WXXGXW repeat (2 copies)